MSFQSTVNLDQAFGVPGDIANDGPMRAKPAVLKANTGTSDAAAIVVGSWFTRDTDGSYMPGGTGADAGLLINSKALQSIGTSAGGPLAPTLIVPAGTVGELLEMGEPVVALGSGGNPGDGIEYKLTDGTLKAKPLKATYSGVIAVTTGILTVSNASAGANLGVGTYLNGTGVPPGTYIIALGTGTGGNGTYQTNIATAVAAFTDGVSQNLPDTGYAFIEDAIVSRWANAAAGLAVVKLTN